jgi:hypothetical protein
MTAASAGSTTHLPIVDGLPRSIADRPAREPRLPTHSKTRRNYSM